MLSFDRAVSCAILTNNRMGSIVMKHYDMEDMLLELGNNDLLVLSSTSIS
jgi:hypothetical protein